MIHPERRRENLKIIEYLDRIENTEIREIKINSREDTCKNCPELDVNYNPDKSYCNLADGEEVRLKRGQHRPEWCPKRAWKK